MTLIAVNGIRLNVEVQGSGPPVLLLHGFTGSSRTWASHMKFWREFTTVAVDLPGHGKSDCPVDPDRYRMKHCIDDVLTLLDNLGIHHTAVLGYSMGGRIALHLALHAPARLWALVLESASPGIPEASEREARCKSDAALAETIERDGIVAFVDYWQDLPLFSTQARLPDSIRQALRRQRLNNNPLGLANSLRGLGAGRQKPVLHCLKHVQVPTLLLAGELDAKYRELARQLAAVLPQSQPYFMPESGHAIHLEQPRTFATVVQRFLIHCWHNQAEIKKETTSCL
jgi:2-succinyl-6-hydroxy-2,4-cyclohexadiene-1-carboxylate synthase